MNRHTTITLTALLLAPLTQVAAEELPDGVRRVGPSELRIAREYIGEPGLARPVPQGLVDVNPPWLHVQVPFPPGKQAARAQQWKRRFYFKLSQDADLKRDVIESGPKRWSFFSPYSTLATGTWYWTYGVAAAESPDEPVWQKEVFSFVVDDPAFAPAIPPTPEQALAALRKRKSGPVAVCTSEDIGHMLPERTWPELAARMRRDAEKALRDGQRPVSIELTRKDIPARLGENPKESFFMVKLRALFTAEERRVDALLRGYLLTGDERFKRLGLQRASELERKRLNRTFDTPAGKIPLTRPAFYNTVPMLMLDAFWDDLPEAQRQAFVALALSLMDKRGNGFPHLHDQLEHAHFNQHDWQGDIKNLLLGSAILSRHRADLNDWFSYAYELWLYRSPALSRTDGGSMDGNGYLGVHEEPLTHLNWMLMRHTGYNFFRAKRWFTGFPNYMSYMNPVGNPGVPFSDGGDASPGVHYLTEMLAYTCPENPAHLGRFKTQGRRSVEEFGKDIVKGYKAMALLQMWRQFPAPELTQARPPAESAAVFRDVGLVGMHSDILDATRNMAVSFSSAVNGSFQHLHPAQNAFCIGYGGEPLFWRSGYYNGGQMHDALSYKASRAHNTLLVDGLMQGFDLGAYGWMPRFATGRRISYALGDASHAYNGMFPKYGVTQSDDPLPPGLIVLGVPVTRENGFGKPGVTRFRRHLVMLRPSHLLLYDELEAEKPVTWTFLLHSLKPMRQPGNAWFTTANSAGAGSARLFCAAPVAGSVTDQFFAAAVDEENKRGGENPPHWHVAIATREKLRATRFLTVIEVQPIAVNLTEPTAVGEGNVKLQVGDYTIAAELDASRPSLLEIRNREETCALVTGQAADGISLGADRRRAAAKGSTLLWEREPGKPALFREEVDQLPPVLLYGNRY
jgi:hypothetical protein